MVGTQDDTRRWPPLFISYFNLDGSPDKRGGQYRCIVAMPPATWYTRPDVPPTFRSSGQVVEESAPKTNDSEGDTRQTVNFGVQIVQKCGQLLTHLRAPARFLICVSQFIVLLSIWKYVYLVCLIGLSPFKSSCQFEFTRSM